MLKRHKVRDFKQIISVFQHHTWAVLSTRYNCGEPIRIWKRSCTTTEYGLFFIIEFGGLIIFDPYICTSFIWMKHRIYPSKYSLYRLM